ncbi:heavy metal-associated domain-containing protein [uncultured Winogradskyella sp.]|uniref:heavy-metal-associated domain-containing protein n=1 Tax=uncultured Winogradskyella sp. TaxID=395353 RepID=UPI002624314D|nr:heavy metal-associated domain-containing protein [uncultured Winogradskyella sp.]
MQTTIQIQNLKCHGCANTIVTKLSKLNGISEVVVNNESDEVSFDYHTATQFELAKKKLSELGYPITDQVNSFSKKAKSFVSCAVGRITK